MTSRKPLTQNDPDSIWAPEAARLGLTVAALMDQVRIADEILDEVMAEEKSQYLTAERAQEILDTARASKGMGPWVDRIQMTPAEKGKVIAFWNTLPGNTTFMDALTRLARS